MRGFDRSMFKKTKDFFLHLFIINVLNERHHVLYKNGFIVINGGIEAVVIIWCFGVSFKEMFKVPL